MPNVHGIKRGEGEELLARGNKGIKIVPYRPMPLTHQADLENQLQDSPENNISIKLQKRISYSHHLTTS